MEDSRKNKLKELGGILLLTLIFALGTYAWYVWSSKDNTNMNVTIGELADVTFKSGNDINIDNLSPSFYYDDGALTEFSIKKKSGVTDELNSNIYLNITSIDDNLKDSNFKYVLLSSSDNTNYSEVVSGDFSSATIGKFNLVKSTPLNDGRTYYKFYIWIDGNNENNELMQGKSLKGTLNVEVSTPTVNAVTLVNSLDDGTTGDSGSGVYKVEHDAITASSSATGSEIPASTDYRYYGASPNNYICLDMEGGSTCPDKHLYRVIGSIYEELSRQNLLKVIKATPLTDGTTSIFSWDYKIIDGDESYDNIWATVTSGTSSGSTSMQLLNGIWLTRGSGSYYNNSTTAKTINFNNYGPSDKAQSLINTTSRYYLGGYSSNSLKTPDIYLAERGTTTSSGNSKYWDGKIALMYPSDYGYAAGNMCVTGTAPHSYYNECVNKDWIKGSYEWTITPCNSSTFLILYLTAGNTFSNASFDVNRLSPVFYLKPDTNIIDGDGSEASPYILSLD